MTMCSQFTRALARNNACRRGVTGARPTRELSGGVESRPATSRIRCKNCQEPPMMTSRLSSRDTARRLAPEPRNFQAKDSKKILRKCGTAGSLIAAICFTSIAAAGGSTETDLVTNRSPLKDANGIVHTPTQPVDANLVNPWGVGESPGTTGSPFWVSDNGAGVSTLYVTNGTKVGLTVSIPA